MWRAKRPNPPAKIIGYHYNLSERRLEWGLRFSCGLSGMNNVDRDAERGDGRHFVVHADGKLSAFLELETGNKMRSDLNI
jgi:hypothetical protein